MEEKLQRSAEIKSEGTPLSKQQVSSDLDTSQKRYMVFVPCGVSDFILRAQSISRHKNIFTHREMV